MTDEPAPAPVTEALVEQIANLGRALGSATNVGDPAPAVVKLRDRMRRPRPGDLVMEDTGFGGAFDPDSVGRLIRIEGNPELPDRYVIEPLLRPGEEQGWANALFIALPDQRSVDRWAGSL